MAEPPQVAAAVAQASAAPAPAAEKPKKDDGAPAAKPPGDKVAADASDKGGDKKKEEGGSAKKPAAKKNPLRAKYPSLKVDERIKLAAAFINDAQNGRFEHGEASGVLKGSWNHWAFSVYYNSAFQNLVLVCILIHLSIIFFEPANSRSDDRATLERIGFLVLELLLTCVHLFDTWLKILHMGKKEFLSKGWNSYTLYYRLAIGADALFCLITGVRFRFSRVLRPALLVTRNRELRQLYDTVSQTVFELVEIATLILSLILLYTAIAVQLFGGACPDEWGNYWSSALSLFVLLTGDNYPDIFQKPFELSPAYVLFFVSFLFLGVQMLLPLVLAIVVEQYKDQQKDIVSKDRVKERKGLIEAFVLLDHKNEKSIDVTCFEELMKIREGPKVSREKVHFLFKALDTTGNGRIDMLEWLDLCDILLGRTNQIFFVFHLSFLKFQELPPETAPKKVVDPERKKKFESLGSNLALLNGYGYLAVWVFGQPLLTPSIFHGLDTALLFVFAAELVVRAFLAEDIVSFLWNKEEFGWNRLDFIVLTMALISKFSWFFPDVVPPTSFVGVLAIVMGSLRVVRAVYNDPRIRERIAVILRVAPFMWYFSVAILMTYYAFAVLGMELLGGRLSDQYENFNNFWASLLTLFSMMMLADWSNTMYDAMEATSIAIVIFFVLFYIIVVVIVLNLFLAVILDAYSVQDQSTEEVEMEIDSATPGQPKKRVLVTKRSVQWKRELLRGELPELKKQELAQLSKGNDIDLVSLYSKKEEQQAKNPASASLHATLFGAHFVAKVKIEAAKEKEAAEKAAIAKKQDLGGSDKAVGKDSKDEKNDAAKVDEASKDGKPPALGKGMGAALARARANIAARKESGDALNSSTDGTAKPTPPGTPPTAKEPFTTHTAPPEPSPVGVGVRSTDVASAASPASMEDVKPKVKKEEEPTKSSEKKEDN